MKQQKKDLQLVTKEVKILTKKVGQLTAKLRKTAVDELGHAQAAIKLKPPAQHAADALRILTQQTDKLLRAVEKFEKEKATRRRKVRKPTKKATGKKKASEPTATDQVLKIIKSSKKGVDVPTLMNKTGFDEKKVRNIISRAFKQRKIKRTGRGVYVGT